MEYIEKVSRSCATCPPLTAKPTGHLHRVLEAKGQPADSSRAKRVAVGEARKDWKELMDYLGM